MYSEVAFKYIKFNNIFVFKRTFTILFIVEFKNVSKYSAIAKTNRFIFFQNYKLLVQKFEFWFNFNKKKF